jgi:hypothetical protein
MKDAVVAKRWGYFYQDLKKIGSLPLTVKAKFESMKYSRGTVQAGYKQMNDSEWPDGKFPGTLSDYLCLVSVFYLIMRFRQTSVNISLVDWARYVLDSCAENSFDVRNTIRLFRTNSNFFSLVCRQLECQNEIIARVKANCLLAGFLEILKNKEFNGGMSLERMNELVDWLKQLAN